MSQSENERPTKTQPEPKAASADRELSDGELETVAGGGDKYEPPPSPPGGPGKKGM